MSREWVPQEIPRVTGPLPPYPRGTGDFVPRPEVAHKVRLLVTVPKLGTDVDKDRIDVLRTADRAILSYFGPEAVIALIDDEEVE